MSKVFLVNIDLSGNQLLNTRLENLGASPVSSPAMVGRLIYNTTTNLIQYDTGTVIQTLVNTTNAIVQGGNSFGAALTVGTLDAFDVNFIRNGLTKWSIDSLDRLKSANGKISLDPLNSSIKINGATDNDQISGYSNATATVNWLRFKADNRDSAKDSLLFSSVESGTSGGSTLTINSRISVSRLNVYSDSGGVFLATNITGAGLPGIGTTGSDLIVSPSTNVLRFDSLNGIIGSASRGIGTLYVGGSFSLIQQASAASSMSITTGLTRDDIIGSALNITGSATFSNLGRYFSILDSGSATLFSVGKLGNTAIGTSLTANSTLHIGGSLSLPYRLSTVATSFTATDHTIDCAGSAFTVTLPTAVGIQGRVYRMKNTSGGTKTIATTSSQTIDGSATQTRASGAFIVVQSNNTNWIIIG